MSNKATYNRKLASSKKRATVKNNFDLDREIKNLVKKLRVKVDGY